MSRVFRDALKAIHFSYFFFTCHVLFTHSIVIFIINLAHRGASQDTPHPHFYKQKSILIKLGMIEFMEDVVKLFSNVNEEEPLPIKHKVVAIVTCVAIAGVFIAYFYW